MGIYFVELHKFNKQLHELENNADKCKEIPEDMQDQIFVKAFSVVNRAGWSKEELMAYFLDIDAQCTLDSQFETAKKAAKKKVLSKGVTSARLKLLAQCLPMALIIAPLPKSPAYQSMLLMLFQKKNL